MQFGRAVVRVLGLLLLALARLTVVAGQCVVLVALGVLWVFLRMALIMLFGLVLA